MKIDVDRNRDNHFRSNNFERLQEEQARKQEQQRIVLGPSYWRPRSGIFRFRPITPFGGGVDSKSTNHSRQDGGRIGQRRLRRKAPQEQEHQPCPPEKTESAISSSSSVPDEEQQVQQAQQDVTTLFLNTEEKQGIHDIASDTYSVKELEQQLQKKTETSTVCSSLAGDEEEDEHGEDVHEHTVTTNSPIVPVTLLLNTTEEQNNGSLCPSSNVVHNDACLRLCDPLETILFSVMEDDANNEQDYHTQCSGILDDDATSSLESSLCLEYEETNDDSSHHSCGHVPKSSLVEPSVSTTRNLKQGNTMTVTPLSSSSSYLEQQQENEGLGMTMVDTMVKWDKFAKYPTIYRHDEDLPADLNSDHDKSDLMETMDKITPPWTSVSIPEPSESKEQKYINHSQTNLGQQLLHGEKLMGTVDQITSPCSKSKELKFITQRHQADPVETQLVMIMNMDEVRLGQEQKNCDEKLKNSYRIIEKLSLKLRELSKELANRDAELNVSREMIAQLLVRQDENGSGGAIIKEKCPCCERIQSRINI